MTQHLLQPERCLSSRLRSLLPPKHEFYFQVQSRTAGWAGLGWAGLGPGPGPGPGPGCGWLMAAVLFLPPSRVVFGNPELAVVPRPRWDPRAPRAQRPGPGAVCRGRFVDRGPAGVASRGSCALLRQARRQTGAISRAARGSGGGCCRAPGGKREGGGGGGEAAAACGDAPGLGRSRQRERAPQLPRTRRPTQRPSRARGGLAPAPSRGTFPPPCRAGASSKGPRGQSGPRGRPLTPTGSSRGLGILPCGRALTPGCPRCPIRASTPTPGSQLP